MFKKTNSLSIFRFSVLLIFLSIHTSTAQNPAGRFLNEADKIPSLEVYSILEDTEGFIWIGCEAGIYKYNGVSFEFHAPDNLQSKEISGLTLGKDGNIYAYNFSGQIIRTNSKKSWILPTVQSEVKEGFPSIFADHNRNIYAVKRRTLAKFTLKKDEWQYVLKDKDEVMRMYAFQNKTFLTKDTTIYEIQNQSFKAFSIEWQENDERFLGAYILTSLSNQLALVHNLGKRIFVLDGNRFVSHPNKNLLKAIQNRKINEIKQFGNETWLMTYTGLVVWDADRQSIETYYDDIAFSNGIQDQRGQIWLTTLKQGILLIPNRKIISFSKDFFKIKESRINHLAYLPVEDKLYLSFLNGDIGALSISSLNFQAIKTGFQGDINLLEAHQNALFFNVRDTIFRLRNTQKQMLANKLLPPKNLIFFENQVFMGSSAGLLLLSLDFKVLRKLCTQWIKDLFAEESTHKLWVASDKGILIFKKKGKEITLQKHILKDEYFRKIGFLNPELPIIGVTVSGKIYDLNNETRIDKPALTDNRLVYSATIFSEKIILATNQGLDLYDATSAKPAMGTLKGLTSGEVYQTIIVNGNIWAATSNGLFRIPWSILENKSWIPPKIFLRRIEIDEQAVSLDARLNLAHYQKLKIKVEVSAMASAQNYSILYRLHPQANWEQISPNNPYIILNSLPKDNFRIEIKGEDHQKILSANQLSIEVRVRPPFWEQWWFYGALMLLSGLLVALIWQNRLQYWKRQQKIKEEKIAIEHRLRLSKLTALKAQMKPHFIFNVLNSIQSFIYQNNTQNAKDYLGRFSKFMRQVLAFSDKERLSLAEELDAIRIYVELEALQLDDEFEFELTIEDGIDTTAYYLPAFLTQPLVENVFKHAFRGKKGLKKLTIEIQKKSENFFSIIVQDNGIGRAQARQNAQLQTQKFASFASDAIAEKIRLYNTQSLDNIHLTTDDLMDGEVSRGTRVCLTIKNEFDANQE